MNHFSIAKEILVEATKLLGEATPETAAMMEPQIAIAHALIALVERLDNMTNEYGQVMVSAITQPVEY